MFDAAIGVEVRRDGDVRTFADPAEARAWVRPGDSVTFTFEEGITQEARLAEPDTPAQGPWKLVLMGPARQGVQCRYEGCARRDTHVRLISRPQRVPSPAGELGSSFASGITIVCDEHAELV